MAGCAASLVERACGGEPGLPFDEWMTAVTAEFEAVASNPRDFPCSAPLAAAVLVNFGNDRGKQLAQILHKANPERVAPEAYRLIRSGYVAQLLCREGYTFPDDYPSPGHCLEGIRWAENTFPFGNRLNEIFREYDLSTTIWPRYATAKFLGQIMLHRNGGEGRVRGDIGCSDLTGIAAVQMSDIDPDFSFGGVEVLHKQGGLWVASKNRQDIFEDVVSQRDSAGLTVGVDRIDPNSETVRDFVAGSMTPEELKEGILPSGHQKLLHLLHNGKFDDKLRFVRADVAHKYGINKVKEEAGGELDEAYMILAWHQGKRVQRRNKYDGVHAIVKPKGVVVFADFVRRDSSDQEPYLMPLKKWSDLNVIVSVPADRGGRRLYMPMQWTNGRCRQVRFTSDLVELARGGPYEDHARELDGSA